jgi:hypothetical protein
LFDRPGFDQEVTAMTMGSREIDVDGLGEATRSSSGLLRIRFLSLLIPVVSNAVIGGWAAVNASSFYNDFPAGTPPANNVIQPAVWTAALPTCRP